MVKFCASTLLLIAALLGASSPSPQMDGSVFLRVLSEHDGAMELELTISNKSPSSVYAMTNPRRSDGTAGPYFAADENDPGLLRCEFRTYSLPAYYLYRNDTRVELKRLEPGREYRETFSVVFPVARTVPPYGSSSIEPKELGDSFPRMVAVVGTLPANDGIDRLLETYKTRFVKGLESIAPGGSRIFDAQTLLTSNIINLQTH